MALRMSRRRRQPVQPGQPGEAASGGAVPGSPAGDGEAWRGETRRLGQVGTPGAVAAVLARWVMSGRPSAVLDPAAGPGSLLAACRRWDGGVRLVGIERDRPTWERAAVTAPPGTELVLGDYLKSDLGRFPGILANPPYVKAQRLAYSERDWRGFEKRLGTRLDRLTNLYGLFLLKIGEDLAPGGRAAVLVPAEFLNANFGEEIKARWLQVLRPVAVLVFAPWVRLFAAAQTTSAIVLLEKGRPADAPIAGRRVDSVEEAEACVEACCAGTVACPGGDWRDLSAMPPAAKWLNVLLEGSGAAGGTGFARRVGDYFTCHRGIATGANDYFCLRHSDLERHRLAVAHVGPCLTKAAEAQGLVFDRAKWRALVRADRRCYLLDPGALDRALRRYLRLGEARGIPERHLPRHRPVWFRPERRPPADLWIAVFSRGPVKAILNTSGARNLTCFHGLYARPGMASLAPWMTLFLNGTLGRRAFAQVNRFYGDGLRKLEPRDVEEMGCPPMPAVTAGEAAALARTLRALEGLPLPERTAQLDALAERWFGSSAAGRRGVALRAEAG